MQQSRGRARVEAGPVGAPTSSVRASAIPALACRHPERGLQAEGRSRMSHDAEARGDQPRAPVRLPSRPLNQRAIVRELVATSTITPGVVRRASSRADERGRTREPESRSERARRRTTSMARYDVVDVDQHRLAELDSRRRGTQRRQVAQAAPAGTGSGQAVQSPRAVWSVRRPHSIFSCAGDVVI